MNTHSTYEDRNTDLFFDIADVLEFFPERYDQRTWGDFTPGEADYVRFQEQFGYDTKEKYGDEDVNWIHADVGCGSALCVAGHAAAMRGWLPTVYANSSGSTVSWSSVSKEKGQDSSANGSREVSDVAQQLLGINSREARHLFDSDSVWTADDLRKFGKGERILSDEG